MQIRNPLVSRGERWREKQTERDREREKVMHEIAR
jgi:hypothetical protein